MPLESRRTCNWVPWMWGRSMTPLRVVKGTEEGSQNFCVLKWLRPTPTKVEKHPWESVVSFHRPDGSDFIQNNMERLHEVQYGLQRHPECEQQWLCVLPTPVGPRGTFICVHIQDSAVCCKLWMYIYILDLWFLKYRNQLIVAFWIGIE